MCFREGINPNPFGDLGAYCGGSRLAGGFGGCFRKKLAQKIEIRTHGVCLMGKPVDLWLTAKTW